MNFCEGTNQIGRTDNFSNTKKKNQFSRKGKFSGKITAHKGREKQESLYILVFLLPILHNFPRKITTNTAPLRNFFHKFFGTTFSWIFISFIKVFNLFFLGKNLNLLLLFTGNLTNVQLYRKSQYNCIV